MGKSFYFKIITLANDFARTMKNSSNDKGLYKNDIRMILVFQRTLHPPNPKNQEKSGIDQKKKK